MRLLEVVSRLGELEMVLLREEEVVLLEVVFPGWEELMVELWVVECEG